VRNAEVGDVYLASIPHRFRSVLLEQARFYLLEESAQGEGWFSGKASNRYTSSNSRRGFHPWRQLWQTDTYTRTHKSVPALYFTGLAHADKAAKQKLVVPEDSSLGRLSLSARASQVAW